MSSTKGQAINPRKQPSQGQRVGDNVFSPPTINLTLTACRRRCLDENHSGTDYTAHWRRGDQKQSKLCTAVEPCKCMFFTRLIFNKIKALKSYCFITNRIQLLTSLVRLLKNNKVNIFEVSYVRFRWFKMLTHLSYKLITFVVNDRLFKFGGIFGHFP